MLDKDQLNDIVAGIAKNYSEREEIFFTDPNKHFPNKLAIVNIVKDLRRVMFPRYFGDETPTGINPEYFIGETLIRCAASCARRCCSAAAWQRKSWTRASIKSAPRSSAACLKSSASC